MSGTAKIYDAEVTPGKGEIAARYGGVREILGTYRLVDPEGEVGIEVYVGPSGEHTLCQFPVSYRDADNPVDRASEKATITPITHSVLGQRLVSAAAGDPIAAAQFLRTILAADDGAAFSDGTVPYFEIVGTGSPDFGADVTVTDVTVEHFNPALSCGSALIDGEKYGFNLMLPRELKAPTGSGLELIGTDAQGEKVQLASAQLAKM